MGMRAVTLVEDIVSVLSTHEGPQPHTAGVLGVSDAFFWIQQEGSEHAPAVLPLLVQATHSCT